MADPRGVLIPVPAGSGSGGPTGATGPSGPAGPTGATGPSGPAGSGGGSVDWANVPAPVTITGLAPSGDGLFLKAVDDTHPFFGLVHHAYGTLLKSGVGMGSDSSSFKSYITLSTQDGGKIQLGQKMWIGNNTSSKWDIVFHAAATADTVLNAGTTAGVLTINGVPIQTAVIAADGREVGLQELLDEVAALKAEVADLRSQG